jgi:hypothetical protein
VYLKARERNNYPVGYFVTDKDGVVTLNRNHLQRVVQAAIADAPMDYGPGWEDCDHLVIELPDPLEVRRRLKALRDTYPERADELQKLMQRASNERVASSLSFSVKMGEPSKIQVKLEPKR